MAWTLGFIGAGVMAETMMRGVLGPVAADRILASDPHDARRNGLRDTLGIQVTVDNREVVERADLLVLAVKPQSLPAVFSDLHGRFRPHTQVLSIVAGATIGSLQRGLGHAAVARAMPNLPCRVHQGITIWTGAEGEAAERIDLVLSGMGDSCRVEDERDVDKATAVSGTGPAIVAEFVRSFADAANFVGLPRDLAWRAVLATVSGTAEMIRQSDDHVAQLIDEVTSPAGTTSRALQVLKQGRFGAVVTDSVDAAHQRTVALGEALERSLQER